jgi:peptidoglycan/LPS O-acetylase OafA/YrhL
MAHPAGLLGTAYLLQPDLGTGALGKSFAVHGLLLQDVVRSDSPNGALWSIAIEWQIYFVFPLILLVGRWRGPVSAATLTVAVVLLAHGVATLGPPLDKINHVTPQFLALFALGVLAVQLDRSERSRNLRAPLTAAGVAALLAFVLIAATQGSEWVVGRFFWMDLLFGSGVACVLALMHLGGAGRVKEVLTSRACLWLGLFSYSIYLVHAPIVGILDKYVVGPLNLPPLAGFGLFLAFGLPVILALCYGFHLLFEAPFLRYRGWRALREVPIVRLLPWGRQEAADGAVAVSRASAS